MAQRIDHDPATDRMSRTTRTTGVRTESGSLAVPAMLLAGVLSIKEIILFPTLRPEAL